MLGCLASLRVDRRFVAWAAGWSVVALVAFGLVSAIIPNPLFGRQIPPEPFAIWVWLASAPLMGIAGATYSAPVPAPAPGLPITMTLEAALTNGDRGPRALGTLAGLGAFLAIGCPVCNKIALLLLGASGALTAWAPLQPVIGGASLLLLAATAAWRLRIRRGGGACAV